MMNRTICFVVVVCLASLVGSSGAQAAVIKEIFGKKLLNRPITDIKAVDINKNEIKELIVVCNYDKPQGKYSIDVGSYGFLKIYEWSDQSLIKIWELAEITKAISASVVSIGDREDLQVGTFSLHVLRYKGGKYALEGIDASMEPRWPNESMLAKGSFKRKGAVDIIVTTYVERRTAYLRFREAGNPSNIIWTSPVLKKGSGSVVFGDIDNDGRIELLLESGYWVYPDGSSFKIVEIEHRKRDKYGKPLPLFKVLGTSDPGVKFFKAGRTTNKDFDDIFYIEPSAYPYGFGEDLIRASWINNEFEYQRILPDRKSAKGGELTAYNKFDVVDIDGDGLDEIIITEGSGKVVPTEEEPRIADYRERILVLKWSGKRFETILATSRYKGNTQVLLDDITGDKKKEIVVGNAEGEIHIFGQE